MYLMLECIIFINSIINQFNFTLAKVVVHVYLHLWMGSN